MGKTSENDKKYLRLAISGVKAKEVIDKETQRVFDINKKAKDAETRRTEEINDFTNIKLVNAEKYIEWDEQCYQPEESFLSIDGCKDLMLSVIAGERTYWHSVLNYITEQSEISVRLGELGEGGEIPERMSSCDTSDTVGCEIENLQRKLRNKEKETNNFEREYLKGERDHIEELLKEASLDEVKLRTLGIDNEVLEDFSVSEEDIEDLLEVLDDNYNTIENAEIVEAENIEDMFDQTN